MLRLFIFLKDVISKKDSKRRMNYNKQKCIITIITNYLSGEDQNTEISPDKLIFSNFFHFELFFLFFQRTM